MFSKKYVNNSNTPYIDTNNEHRNVSLTNSISSFPKELRHLVELEEVKKYSKELLEYVKGVNDRLDHVEQFLSSQDFELKIQTLGQRVLLLEQKMEKVLTHPNDLALQLTSDKEEIRRLAEEVVKVKQAIGVASGA